MFQNTIELLAIDGNNKFYEDYKSNLGIYQIKIDLDTKQISNKKIYEIKNTYRSLDILYAKNKDILVSYVSRSKTGLFHLNVDRIKLKNDNFDKSGWRYKNELIFKSKGIPPPLLAAQAGGKMAELHNNKIFLAIGDFERSDLVGDKEYNHGKMILIDPKTKSFQIFSKGFRNPQGLYYDDETNSLIETEHGPDGGDEINLIRKNKDYGWPHVTYGIEYLANKYYWSLGNNGGAKYGRHDGYEKPIYAFIPSIGIKAIEKMPKVSPEFSLWQSNYIFCAKNGTYRALLSEDNTRLITQEKILGANCRDVSITPSGKIVTTTELAPVGDSLVNDHIIVIGRDKDHKARN